MSFPDLIISRCSDNIAGIELTAILNNTITSAAANCSFYLTIGLCITSHHDILTMFICSCLIKWYPPLNAFEILSANQDWLHTLNISSRKCCTYYLDTNIQTLPPILTILRLTNVQNNFQEKVTRYCFQFYKFTFLLFSRNQICRKYT